MINTINSNEVKSDEIDKPEDVSGLNLNGQGLFWVLSLRWQSF